MELKINIYNGNEVEKTYVTNDFHLMTGTCEDILSIIDIEKLTGINLDAEDNDSEAIMSLMSMVLKLFGQFNPIMKQIFPEMTDDEYRRTDIAEVTAIVWNVIKYTFGQLFRVAGKN